MARSKTKGIKLKLASRLGQIKFAPIWAAVRKFGRLVHPSRITRIRRHWRRRKIRKSL